MSSDIFNESIQNSFLGLNCLDLSVTFGDGYDIVLTALRGGKTEYGAANNESTNESSGAKSSEGCS